MQSELKPCPFCGSNDLVTEQMEGTIRYPAYRIRCDHCVASSRYSDRDDWWAAWNHRAVDADTPQVPHDAPFASDAEITRLTEALRAAEEREKALREGLNLAANRMDVMALAVSHENNARRYEWHEWAVAARAALKGPSHDA